MIKRIILGLCFLACTMTYTLADSAPITEKEAAEVENFFNSYVESANNYKDDLINHYTNDAKIERIVIKPNGEKETVEIPLERYKKELKLGKITAKLVNYKNKYSNNKYEKIEDNKFKIKTKRTPMNDKNSLNAEFIVTKTQDGLKISSESMETTVQKFLENKAP